MKRVVIYGFVVILLAVLAGCGGGSSSGNSNGDGDGNGSQAGSTIANVPNNLGFDQPKSLK